MASRETQPVQRKSADERKELLAHTVENEVAHGSRVESQSDFQAVLVRGRRPNFVERLILKIAFLGLVFLVRAIRKPGGPAVGSGGDLGLHLPRPEAQLGHGGRVRQHWHPATLGSKKNALRVRQFLNCPEQCSVKAVPAAGPPSGQAAR